MKRAECLNGAYSFSSFVHLTPRMPNVSGWPTRTTPGWRANRLCTPKILLRLYRSNSISADASVVSTPHPTVVGTPRGVCLLRSPERPSANPRGDAVEGGAPEVGSLSEPPAPV